MATVLCLSSEVVRGPVGASAARAALTGLGHEAWVLPTVVLSSHRGHARVAGPTLAARDLAAMLEALEANGWLAEVDAVLTGYLPTPDHVRVAFDVVGRARDANPGLRVLCDPCCGDAPKGLFVAEAAAEAVRDLLLPVADIARLNAFELAWATGRSVTGVRATLDAARALGPATVLVTSAPTGDGDGDLDQDRHRLGNLLATRTGAWASEVPRRDRAPRGLGDFLGALFLGHLLAGAEARAALALSVAGVEAALAASGPSDALKLAASVSDWARPKPWPLEPVAEPIAVERKENADP